MDDQENCCSLPGSRKPNGSLHSSDHAGKVVCVTDCTSYLGSWLVKRLIERGYTVRGTVSENLGQHQRTITELKSLRGAQHCFQVVEADPLDYSSLVNAFGGCNGLIYTSSFSDSTLYNEVTAGAEVRAVQNAIEACAQVDSIERVVMTSSAAAILWQGDSVSEEVLDEKRWSNLKFCREKKLWYALSKTMAERAAWLVARDRGVHFVSINPALIVGPSFQARNATPTLAYLRGAAEMYQNGVLATAHVRNVADVHIWALEDTSAFGRYICFDRLVNCADRAMELARDLTPLVSFPQRIEDPTVYPECLSNLKLQNAAAKTSANLCRLRHNNMEEMQAM